MGMIEEKWNALFETYGIAEQVKRQGIFSIYGGSDPGI